MPAQPWGPLAGGYGKAFPQSNQTLLRQFAVCKSRKGHVLATALPPAQAEQREGTLYLGKWTRGCQGPDYHSLTWSRESSPF